MSKRMARRLQVTAVGLVGVLLVAGCSSAPSGGSGGSKSLNYMSYWTSAEPTAKILKGAITDFTAKTGIKVNATWVGRDLNTKLAPLFASGGTPKTDLVDMGCSDAASRVYGLKEATNLNPVLDMNVPDGAKTVRDLVAPSFLAAGQSGGTTFCLPYEGDTENEVWFNAARFPDLVNNPPKTWPEFMKLIHKGSIALDGDIGPYNAAYFVNLAVSAGGKGVLLKAATDKTGNLFKSDPAFLKAAKVVATLAADGDFIQGYNASKFPAMENLWAQNKADFHVDGSWVPAEVAPAAAPGFKYASFPFPAITSGAPRVLQAGAIGFELLKGSPNAANAEKFMAFMLQKKYQDELGAIALPVRPGATVSSSLVGAAKDASDTSLTTTSQDDGILTAGYGEYAQKVLEPLSSKLILGTMDANKFISEMSSQTAAYWSNH